MIRQICTLLLLLPLGLAAQKSTSLRGKLANAKVESVELWGTPPYLRSQAGTPAPLASEQFNFELKLDAPTALELRAGDRRIPLFLIPGENLVLEADLASESSDAIAFSGPGSAYNQYLQQFYAEHGTYFDVAAMNAQLVSVAIDPWELKLYQAERTLGKALEVEFKDRDYPEAFRNYLQAEVASLHDRWMIAYPIVRAEANAKAMTVKHLPRIYEGELREGLKSRPQDLVSPVYRDLIWYSMVYFTSAENGFAKFTDYNKSVNAKFDYASAQLSDRVLTWYSSKLLADNCDKVAPGTVERLQTAIKKGEGGAAYLKATEAICKEANAGKVAQADTKDKSKKKTKSKRTNMAEEKYEFRMVDLKGDELNLSDFAGKVVYIDFWASWCGPCRAQMPFSKKLHHRIEDELPKKDADDIVFLYISIDQDENAWRNGIDAMSIEGTHGFSNARWPDGAGQFFQIPGIPRYMIMDKSGEIVNRNAPRPSMDGIFEELKGLVAQ
ncbi:MAG: TlpA disulfide reductase family protein [Bacteroidota bacterium]